MKILIIEYITGGGLARQALPVPLAGEGEMMFTALVDDLLAIDDVELVVTRDYRLPLPSKILEALAVITITPEPSFSSQLLRLFEQCDAVWPIAPETDGILYDLCCLIESTSTILLASPSQTIKMAADKLATYQHLTRCNIKAVKTHRLKGFEGTSRDSQIWVIKPSDGVACAGIVSLTQAQLDAFYYPDQSLLIQPFIKGRTLSLSCLFNNGKGWLICVNEQLIQHQSDQFVLHACRVNIAIDKQPYSTLVADIAKVMPGLWGYIGIDLIETETDPLLLEINPRLTTSYTGIKLALGVNVAAAVLNILNNQPILKFLHDQPALINIPR